MNIALGALYEHRDEEEVRRAWSARLRKLQERRLILEVERNLNGRVRLTLRPRAGTRVPHKRMGKLVRLALGPEREEHAEFWLLEPARAAPGALRLAGADWRSCLASIGDQSRRQVRLWSPLVCPGPRRRELELLGKPLGLVMREADSWALMAVPQPKPQPPTPPPWRGNYGW